MAVTADSLKEYAYASDDNWQTAVAERCIAAAKAYLANAGVSERADDPLYDMAVQMLAMHWYDNRGVILIGTVGNAIEKGVTSIIHQLAYEPTEEGDA